MSFFFAVAFTVLVFWRPQEWLIPWLYGWPLLDVIVVMGVLALIMEVDQRRQSLPSRAPQGRLLLGLWFASAMSHVAHTYFGGMMATIPEVFKLCFFAYLLFVTLDRPKRLWTVAAVFVAMACVMAVHALLQDRRGFGFAGLRPMYIPPMSGRPAYTRTWFFGIFSDPNDMAQFFATSIPFAFILVNRGRFLRLLVGLAVSWLLVTAVFTTGSRGGLVALATVVVTMAAMRLPARSMPALLTIGLPATMIAFPFSGPILDESAHDRVVAWGEANAAFKSNPVFGIGWNMFTDTISEARAAHNAFVQCYTELGVFGYWFWFTLILLGVVGAWRARVALSRSNSPEAAWLWRFSGLSIASMAGFAASSYFLSRSFVFPLFFLVALLGAVPVVARRYLPDGHKPLVDFRRDAVVLGGLASLASIVYIYFSIILMNKVYYG